MGNTSCENKPSSAAYTYSRIAPESPFAARDFLQIRITGMNEARRVMMGCFRENRHEEQTPP